MLGEPNLLAEVAVAVHQASKPILSLDVSDTPVLLVAWRILAHLGPIFFWGVDPDLQIIPVACAHVGSRNDSFQTWMDSSRVAHDP
jgi:hypothetical protein